MDPTPIVYIITWTRFYDNYDNYPSSEDEYEVAKHIDAALQIYAEALAKNNAMASVVIYQAAIYEPTAEQQKTVEKVISDIRWAEAKADEDRKKRKLEEVERTERQQYERLKAKFGG